MSGNSLKQKLTTSCGCLRKEKVRQALFKDISNKIFGRLTALQEISFNKYGSLWECQCACGNYVKALSGSLSSGHVKSCGCLIKDVTIERNKQNGSNITGQKFTRLLVMSLNAGSKKRLWNCLCDCGKTITATTNSLLSGNTSSCGCLRRDLRTPNLIGEQLGKLTVIKKLEVNSKHLTEWLCQCKCGKQTILTTHIINKKLTKSCGCLINRKGSENPNYKHNISQEERNIRNETRRGNNNIKKWRKEIFTRDNYTCQITNIKSSGNIVAHHIFNWATNPDKRYDLENGITLHVTIHKLYHKLYGNLNTTLDQFKEFKDHYISKKLNEQLPEILRAK